MLSQDSHVNNKFVSQQFDFRKGTSTQNAAYKLTCSAFKFLNQKGHVGGPFCYLTKAIACVNNEILVGKLHFVDFKEQVRTGPGPNR
jgi:hypothetical protein